jgi:hypothetical protein
MSPVRVPITRPSSGVNPMEVSMERAGPDGAGEAPLPRWSVMIFVSSRERPVS